VAEEEHAAAGVAETTQREKTAAAEAKARGEHTKEFSACGLFKPKAPYSYRQWVASVENQRCAPCVQAVAAKGT
jgi:hypothetical protein